MQVTGIITEYNPFHNGHAYQLAKLRALDPDAEFICVMSGSFTPLSPPMAAFRRPSSSVPSSMMVRSAAKSVSNT